MPAITVTETTTIERPPDEVFRYIGNPEHDVEWCPAVQEVRLVRGEPGAPGAAYFMRHTPGGMKFEAEIEILDVEPPRRFRWLMTDAHSRIQGCYELEPAEGGTRLTQTSEVDFRGLWRIPGFVLRGYIAKDIRKYLRDNQFPRLKQILEGGAPAEGPA